MIAAVLSALVAKSISSRSTDLVDPEPHPHLTLQSAVGQNVKKQSIGIVSGPIIDAQLVSLLWCCLDLFVRTASCFSDKSPAGNFCRAAIDGRTDPAIAWQVVATVSNFHELDLLHPDPPMDERVVPVQHASSC